MVCPYTNVVDTVILGHRGPFDRPAHCYTGLPSSDSGARMRQAGIALVAALVAGNSAADPTVALELLADGLAQPLAIRNAGDGFVKETT